MLAVLWEDHGGSARELTLLSAVPRSQVLWSLEVFSNSRGVEGPSVFSVALLDQALSEQTSQLRVFHCRVDVIQDGSSWFGEIDLRHSDRSCLDLLESIIPVVVERSEVQAEKPCESVKVSGGCLESQETSDTVSSQCGSRDLMIVHESSQVISHGLVVEVVNVVRVSEVSWIKNPNVPVVQNLGSRDG